MLPWKGSVQLAMESSTPFLNIMLLLHNRGDRYRFLTVPCGIIFVLLYVYFRIIQNTYATAILWLRRDVAFPPGLPVWQMILALMACTAGAAMQFFWFPGIVRKLLKLLPELGKNPREHTMAYPAVDLSAPYMHPHADPLASRQFMRFAPE